MVDQRFSIAVDEFLDASTLFINPLTRHRATLRKLTTDGMRHDDVSPIPDSTPTTPDPITAGSTIK